MLNMQRTVMIMGLMEKKKDCTLNHVQMLVPDYELFISKIRVAEIDVQ